MPTSEYLASALGKLVLNEDPFTPPTDLYLILYSVAPTRAGGGTEVSGGLYERKPITFTEGDPGVFGNSPVEITEMPAGTVAAAGIIDDDTAGNLLYFVEFEEPLTLEADEPYYVASGTFRILH